MELSFNKSNEEIDRLIDTLMEQTGGVHHPQIVREMVIAALKAGQENDYLADIKFINNSLKEMRYTNKAFAPYRHRKKVTIFGSARTREDEPIYQKCVEFSRKLAEKDYMIITGGGPGIMEAGNRGAGSENSFAVNIHLPFEQSPNRVMLANPRLITYRYFFNRKVAFVKESEAIAVFPGGFGTLDEAMEVFTLIQTGKTSPKPLVLVDSGDGFWDQWLDFLKNRLLVGNLISAEDFSIFTITHDVDDAVRVISEFYRNYHSVRFIRDQLVIRLNRELSAENLECLNNEFPDLRTSESRVVFSQPHPDEADEPDLLSLPRISLRFNHMHYGLLMAFIWRINTF